MPKSLLSEIGQNVTLYHRSNYPMKADDVVRSKREEDGKHWLKLSARVSQVKDLKWGVLISGYLTQIANAILYEALFGIENIGRYSGTMVGLPLPDIKDISAWFEEHYKPTNIVRQILYAIDNFYAPRVIEGKA